MSKKPDIKDFKKVLAVEGSSDLYFFAEVLEFLGSHQNVYIQQFNGATDLIIKLETFLSPGLLAEKEAIAIIVDADANADARKRAISNMLAKCTGRAIEHGVWSAGQPNLGFFVVTDGIQAGEIETLVWQAWAADPANQQPRDCIVDYISCMSAAGQVPQSIDKGRIGALLAVMNDEDPRLGPGARSNVFALGRPEYHPLRDFPSQL